MGSHMIRENLDKLFRPLLQNSFPSFRIGVEFVNKDFVDLADFVIDEFDKKVWNRLLREASERSRSKRNEETWTRVED